MVFTCPRLLVQLYEARIPFALSLLKSRKASTSLTRTVSKIIEPNNQSFLTAIQIVLPTAWLHSHVFSPNKKDKMGTSNRETNFSSQRSAIPFGKFETGSDDIFPCNESMVGREGARAKLIDFLTNAGTRKAILVTGRRGMGKTSFVNYCLKEYEEARIERYWRSDIGRTISAWLWLTVISVICAAILVLGSWLLKPLLDNAINEHNYFFWLPIAVLVFYLSYPLRHAVKVIAVLFKIKPSFPAKTLGYLFVVVFVGVFTVIPDAGSPVTTLSRLLVVLAATYFSGELLDTVKPIVFKGIRLSGFLLPLVGLFISSITFSFYDFINKSEINLTNVALASLFIALALFCRGDSLFRKGKYVAELQIGTTLKKSSYWFFSLGIVCLLFSIVILNTVSHVHSDIDIMSVIIDIKYVIGGAILFIGILCKVLVQFSSPQEKKTDEQYGKRTVYSTAILLVKAIFLILLSLYALHPLITLTPLPSQSDCQWQSFSASISDIRRPFCNVAPPPVEYHDPNKNVFLLNYRPQLLNAKHELAYIVLIVAITAMIFWIEYEWIIRPAQTWRRDKTMHVSKRPNHYEDFDVEEKAFEDIKETGDKARKAARKEVQRYMQQQANIRERRRAFEALTFLGYFKHLHLTTLISTINLGFEELDHRSVIHAMLLDIRGQYYEKFVSLRSPRVLVRYCFGLLLAMMLVNYVSTHFFKLKPTHQSEQQQTSTKANMVLDSSKQSETAGEKIDDQKRILLETKYCYRTNKQGLSSDTNGRIPVNSGETRDNLPNVPRLLCELGGFYAEKILPLIYFELIPIHLEKNDLPHAEILNVLFDTQLSYLHECHWVAAGCSNAKEMNFYAYHLLLFALVFYLFRRINRAFELIPFAANLEKIDELLQALTSTAKTTSRRDLKMDFRFSSGSSGNEKSLEREKLDPRLVELQFMNVLEKICHSSPYYFKPLQSQKKSPTIEITFVFDELDKLANDINTQQQKGDPDNNDSELHRLNLMKGLLSNMKRIITSSEARYIFLGGRLLHDDWLADSARRQPLLTSIFSDEIYLPSLLTDAGIDWYTDNAKQKTSPGIHPLDTRIEEFFVWQYYLARIRFEHWVKRVWMPIIGLPEWDDRPRGFIQVSYRQLKSKMLDAAEGNSGVKKKENCENAKTPIHTLTIRKTDDGDYLNEDNINSTFQKGRLEAFIQFLAYRSAGNPKYLNELLASFVMSADRAIEDASARHVGFNCQDVLYLPDHKVMRIQLIARIYRQLCKGFEEKIRGRDDKTIVSLIYLSDFLFKFHARAFSWDSLELIDELVHMHRGHDLRTLLHELVEHYTDRYLHRIINGMYTYRFRSYFANEIEYLSRHSEEEMAAFNFTLDEAQTLRSHLEGQLDSSDKNNPSGENRHKTDIMSMLGELHEFYQEYDMARQYYRRCITARLPMIKEFVGETVGNGDEEITVLQAIYTNRPTSRQALLALQHWGPTTLRWFLQIVMTFERQRNYNDALIRYERYITFANSMITAFATYAEKEKSQDKKKPENAFVLEFLGLLTEPLFAYAWLLEKNSYSSGSSHFVLYRGVREYISILKVVKSHYLGYIHAQWYKKMGALCFYKGLAITHEKPEGTEDEPLIEKNYVTRAREYYSLSAIQLSIYFRKGVKTKFKNTKVKSLSEAFLINSYPTDYNFSVAECLGDLSESILAEINPVELFKADVTDSLLVKKKSFNSTTIKLLRQLDHYFFNSNRKFENICILNLLSRHNYNQNGLKTIFKNLNDLEKFDLALNLSFASSFYLLRAGYLESAAREAMHTAEVVAQYLNWYWYNIVTTSTARDEIVQNLPAIEIAMNKVIWYTGYIKKLFESLRMSDPKAKRKDEKTYLMGDFIPSSALTTLCSIGMSLSFFYPENYCFETPFAIKTQGYVDQLCETIQKWTGNEKPFLDEFQGPFVYKYEYLKRKLIYALQRHRYPVLNQLNALKFLVDASLVSGYLIKGNDATKNTKAWLQELYQINEKYNHPLHFTPMQVGLSLYLYDFVMNKKNQKGKREFKLYRINNFSLTAEYRRLLIQSQDICHMGRGYYEAIDKMYYLYDDFNDNQIHRNHAMQMAGSKLTRIALKKAN